MNPDDRVAFDTAAEVKRYANEIGKESEKDDLALTKRIKREMQKTTISRRHNLYFCFAESFYDLPRQWQHGRITTIQVRFANEAALPSGPTLKLTA